MTDYNRRPAFLFELAAQNRTEYHGLGEDVLPRIEWTKRIGEGGVIPDGYGVAWRDWPLNLTVCMPLPLNVIAGWARWLWIELRHGLGIRLDRDVQRQIEAFEQGHDDGIFQERRRSEYIRESSYRDGYTQGRIDAIADILKDLDARRSAPPIVL